MNFRIVVVSALFLLALTGLVFADQNAEISQTDSSVNSLSVDELLVAAEAGEQEAQYQLGIIYFDGQNLP